MWFKFSLQQEPNYVECILDYLKILFDNDMFGAIEAYNKENNDILYKVNDNRVRLIVASYEGKMRKFKESIRQYLDIIDSGERDPVTLFICYSNAGITYNDIDRRVEAVQYLMKAIELVDSGIIKTVSICKNAFNNLFISSDYEYLDNEILFRQYEAYDRFVPTKNEFKHNKDKQILENIDINTIVTVPSQLPKFTVAGVLQGAAAPVLPQVTTPTHSSGGLKGGCRPLIGYVSGDFSTHVVSQFIIPILANHSEEFEVHCFYNMDFEDPHFAQRVGPCVKIHLIQVMSDAEAAAYIHGLGIDILIDLSGHTGKNRLEVFALNPAPVQMTYLGFPNTTGLKSIHYRITDQIADHPESKQRYSEKLVYMPKCFLLFDDLYKIPVVPKKTDATRIVLGALNRESKNSAYVMAAWRRIMRECPETAILVKLSGRDTADERTAYYANVLDISTDRLITVGVLDTEAEFAQLYSKIDILMDTFPYSGTTTSCKSLFYSVPIITKYHQDYHVNNVTASLLINTGFPELVAYSDNEYVTNAIKLIRDPDQIERYKKEIKPKFAELMEPRAFMKSYEDLLRNIIGPNV
jgi:predicted O-linked N-acetylglucosamine transferase (SPINDLY family)